MVVAMARDPRVLVIKLADRLHNMRTLRFLPPAKQERKARETLEILAPLAHRLGMNTIKWELEDLAFATLYPKRYDEIVRLVAERAPSRDTYLAEVIERVNADLRDGRHQGRGHRPAQALLLDLPEDDRARPRVHRHLRPGRHPHPGRHRARLLRGARRDPRELAAGAGPVQGLHRDAEVQHVPVAAHDGDRPGRQAGRDADPHAARCTARPSTASPRTGSTRSSKDASVVEPPAVSDEMAWLRQLLDWQREAQEPEEFLDALRFDLGASEVYVFTPKGDVDRAAGRLDAGRLRLRGAHRGRAPVHRRPGQRQAGAAGVDARQRRHRRDLHLEVRERRPDPGLAGVRQVPAGPDQDPAVVRQGAPRGRDRGRQGRADPRRCARRRCRCSGCSAATRC